MSPVTRGHIINDYTARTVRLDEEKKKLKSLPTSSSQAERLEAIGVQLARACLILAELQIDAEREARFTARAPLFGDQPTPHQVQSA